ncbi:MAG: hypothetical protein CNLJKLNK_00927 [Holosporales bacterium]
MQAFLLILNFFVFFIAFIIYESAVQHYLDLGDKVGYIMDSVIIFKFLS